MASSSAQYELIYFDGRGLGEVSRILFSYSATPFTDTRLSQEQWKDSWKSNAPFGKMPLLRIKQHGAETLELPQSRAIERYLAKKLGLYGKTDEEAAFIDAFIDQLQDVRNAIFQHNDSVIENELPTHFTNLSKWIDNHSSSGHAVGEVITWADLALFGFVNSVQISANEWYVKTAAKVAQYPVLTAAVERVSKHDKIAAYVAARKATPF